MKSLMLLAVVTLASICLPGCATDTGNAKKDTAGRVANTLLAEGVQVLGQFAVNKLHDAATQDVTRNGGGQTVSAADSLDNQTVAGGYITPQMVMNVINAWSGNGALSTTAIAAAKEQNVAIQNGVDPTKAAEAVSKVIRAAAIAPTTPPPLPLPIKGLSKN